MKRTLRQFLLFVCLLFVFCACKKEKEASAQQPTAVAGNTTASAGFATQNGGTTGGFGAQVVRPATYGELKLYLETAATPYVVVINKRFYNGEKGGSIRVNSNKSLIGEGSTAFLDGIGLYIGGAKNVIIRNVKISMTGMTYRTNEAGVYSSTGDEGRPQILVNGGDCISIENSTNVWIDHCDMYGEDPAVQTNIDLYDGLVDIKGTSAFITISWSYFHDHHKVHLVGSSDADNFDRRITWHHNYYRNVGSRLPLYRYGKAHVVNNYFNKVSGGGASSRMGACIKVEGNVYEDVKNPIRNDGGNFDLGPNLFTSVSGTAVPTTSTCSSGLPYSFTADDPATVKSKVMAGAGVGKL
jgi:pectate lyase